MLVTLGSHAREWAVAFAAWEPPLLGIRDILNLGFLQRVAAALNARVEIRFVSREQPR